jgi:hypothetical protein
MSLAAMLIMRFNYGRINKQRDAIMAVGTGAENGGYDDAELSKMGDKAPTFRYET